MAIKNNLTLIFILLVISHYSWAQAPLAFNYQGAARDLTGTALGTKSISVKASILDGSLTGPVVYAETHTIATNQFGLFTLAIGTGTATNGTFATVNWASGSKYLKIEIDPNGGSSYTLSGTTQLLSVPYAMYSAKSGTVNGQWTNISGGLTFEFGNIGIATSNPTATLHTNGSVRLQGLTSDNTLTKALVTDANGNVYTKDISTLGSSQWTNVSGGINYSAGKVGIGTLTSTSALEVVGGTVNSPTISIKSGVDNASSITWFAGNAQEQGGSIVYYSTDFTLSSDRVNAGNFITSGGPNGLLFRTYGNGEIKFSTVNDRLSGQSLERVRIDKFGNVGIGTTTPTSTLHTNGTIRFQNLNSNNTLTNALVTDANGNVFTKDISTLGSSQWTNVTGGISYNNGKVGIGVNKVDTWLQIEKSVTGLDRAFSRFYNTSDAQDANTASYWYAGTGTNNAYLDITVNSKGYFPLLGKGGRGQIRSEKLVLVSLPQQNSVEGYVSIETGGDWNIDPNGSVERLRVTYDGKIGIGTTSPTATLHTNGTIRFQNLTANNTLTTALVTDANGNVYTKDISTLATASQWTNNSVGINYNGGKVGIGTTTPSALLEISSPDPFTAGLVLDASRSTGISIGFKGIGAQENAGISYIGSNFTVTSDRINTGNLIINGGPNGQIIRTWGDGEIKFATSNGLLAGQGQPFERMRIDKTGNIGIGTTTPKAKLQVTSGDVYIDDPTKGIIMKNASGQCYRITVGTAGALISTLITCP